MADFISAVASSATAKPTQFIQLDNPAASPDKVQPGLSDAAKSALSSIGDMQTDLQKNLDLNNERRAQALSETKSASGENLSQTEAISEAARTIQTQMEVSLRVQQQLARFVMVSSVSSSFGRNLTMFLRGQ